MQVHGVVEDKNGKTVATLSGKWDESLHYVIFDNPEKGKESNRSSKPCLLWKRSEPAMHPTKYNLTEFAITLNEITPGLQVSFIIILECKNTHSILESLAKISSINFPILGIYPLIHPISNSFVSSFT